MNKISINWTGSYLLRCLLLLSGIVFLLVPLSLLANEVNGRITVRGLGQEVLPSAGTDHVPLKDVTVILGVLERNPLWEPLAFFSRFGTTRTNDNGEYSFYIYDDPDPTVPNSEVDYALIVILDSPAVQAFDFEAIFNDDPYKPACLASGPIAIPIRGVYQADFELVADGGGAGAEVTSSFVIMNNGFDPVLDLTTGSLGPRQPNCDEAVFNESFSAYDVRGFSNMDPNRFAHLAILYARAYDAFEFLRDGLTVPVLTQVRLDSWYPGDRMAYRCDFNQLTVDPTSSDFFGKHKDSRLFAMRHEYGHHFVCGSQIAGVNNDISIPAGEYSHDGLRNSTSAGSWSEGFATYFAAAVSEFKGEATPYIQSIKGGYIDMVNDSILLDDPIRDGEQRYFGVLGEEFAVASLLWRVSELTDSDTLISALDAAGANLWNFADVYAALRLDGDINSSFPAPCFFNDPIVSIAADIDCLFIERGFYHDADGDGLYTDASEFIGANTRWPLTGPSARPETAVRPEVPILDGSILRLSAVDTAGQPVGLDRFDIQIQYYAPYEHASFNYTREISGDGPYEFPILVPARPSRAMITAVKDGFVTSAPVTIESTFYHQRVDPFRDVPVEPILLEHSFTVGLIPVQDPITDLAARAKDGKINITWTPLAQAAGYNIYRSDDSSGLQLIAAGHQSDYAVFADSGLTNGVTYTYVVTWVDSNDNESGSSNEAAATPAALRSRSR